MWAVNKQRILNPEALSLLYKWKDNHKYQSDLWLLPSQLAYLNVKPRRSYADSLSLPLDLLLHGNKEGGADEGQEQIAQGAAFPLSLLPSNIRAHILDVAPPPFVPNQSPSQSQLPLLVEKKKMDEGGDDDNYAYTWRTATIAEFMAASLYNSHVPEGGTPRNKLLCASSVYAMHPGASLPETVLMLNAQETSNPFALDPSLEHRNLANGEALPESLCSALTTVAAQFCYNSFYWTLTDSTNVKEEKKKETQRSADSPVRDVEDAIGALPDQPAAGLEPPSPPASPLPPPPPSPHVINALECCKLVHISQLSPQWQAELVNSLPSFVLLRASSIAYVLMDGRWRSAWHVGVIGKLQHADIPRYGAEPTREQPLLWVEARGDAATNTDCITRVRRREYLVLNVEQMHDK